MSASWGRIERERVKALLAAVSVFALYGSGISGAKAQAAAEGHIDDVVVSAPEPPAGMSERAAEVQKAPRPIVVVDPKTAQQQQLRTLEDFQQKIPNYKANISNPRTSRPAIRGVSQGAGTGDGSEFDTGFIQDNVFWKHVGFQWANFFDLESLELALGPQGTKGGKNTTVGAVIIRNQMPTFEKLALAETTFGNLGHIYERGTINWPLLDNKLAVRVSGYMERQDGWIRDQTTGASYSDINRFAIRAQALYDYDGITDRFIFNHSQSNEYNNYNSGPFADSFQVFANGTRPARTYAETFRQRLGRSLLTLDPYKPYLTRVGVLDQRLFQVSNELSFKIGENTFQSISGYGFFRLNPGNSLGNQLSPIEGTASDTWVDQYSQEFRLSSPTGQPLEWTAGLYGFYEYVWNRSNIVYGTDAAAWYSQPFLLPGNRNNRDGVARDYQLAAYGSATWHVDEKFAITAGIRNSYEIKMGKNYSWDEVQPGVSYNAQVAAITAAGGTARSLYYTGSQFKNHNFVTALVNPQYQITENILGYTIFGYGEKAGAVNTIAQPILAGGQIAGFTDLITKPERSWDYEIGVKTNWFDQTLFLNFNLYWNDLYNFQTNLVDSSFTDNTGQPIFTTFLGVAPHARLRGFEWDGRWAPPAVEGLTFTFSGSITEARWLDFANSPPPPDYAWPAANNVNGVAAPRVVSRSNTRWDNLPVWSFNVGANYERSVTEYFSGLGDWAKNGVTGFSYVNVAWTDKSRITAPASILQYWQKAYTIVNLGFGFRTDDNKYTLGFWAKNVFDERYNPGTWNPGTATTPATMGLQNFPRTFGGTFIVKFL